MELKGLLKLGLWVLLTKAFGAAGMFLVTVLFARWLGAADFGIYSLALTLVTIVSIVSRFGLDQVIVKQVAVDIQNGSRVARKGAGYTISAACLVFILSSSLAILFWCASDFLAEKVFNKTELRGILEVFVWVVIPLSLNVILTDAIKASGRVVISSFLQNVLVPMFVLMACYIVWNMSEFVLYNAVVMHGLSILATLLISIVFLNKLIPNIKDRDPVRFNLLLKEGGPMILVASGALVMSWSDILIIGIYASQTDLGMYSVASRTVMITMLVLVAMNSITAPRYALLFRNGDIGEIEKLAKRSSTILLAMVCIPSFFFIVYPSFVLGLFGGDYTKGGDILTVLAIGQLINVSCGSVGYMLTMTGKEKVMQRIMLTTAATNILLSLVLVSKYGVLGIAFATAFSMVLWNLWALLEVKKHLGFWAVLPRLNRMKNL